MPHQKNITDSTQTQQHTPTSHTNPPALPRFHTSLSHFQLTGLGYFFLLNCPSFTIIPPINVPWRSYLSCQIKFNAHLLCETGWTCSLPSPGDQIFCTCISQHTNVCSSCLRSTGNPKGPQRFTAQNKLGANRSKGKSQPSLTSLGK